MLTDSNGNAVANTEMLPYACFGVTLAGLMYVLLFSALFPIFGTKRVIRYFPPIVTGPMHRLIGLTLHSLPAPTARTNWAIALIAIAIVVGCNIWGKGMIENHPPLGGGSLRRGRQVSARNNGIRSWTPVNVHPDRRPLDRSALPVPEYVFSSVQPGRPGPRDALHRGMTPSCPWPSPGGHMARCVRHLLHL